MAVPEEGLGTTARFLAKNRLNNNVQSWIESCPFQIRWFRFTFNLIQQEKRLQDRSPYMKIKECPAKARLIFIAKRIHGYQGSSTRLMKTKSYESNDISELERWQSFQHSAHLLWSIAVHLSIIRKPLGSKRAMPYYIYSDDTVNIDRKNRTLQHLQMLWWRHYCWSFQERPPLSHMGHKCIGGVCGMNRIFKIKSPGSFQEREWRWYWTNQWFFQHASLKGTRAFYFENNPNLQFANANSKVESSWINGNNDFFFFKT